MASGEAAAAVKTIVLRVSIHCQGCKKKVRKVLNGVEGVHKVTVDGAQHKVTVTGVVDADTLIRRLYKSGKQAVPWQPPSAESKNPEAAMAVAPPVEGGDGGKEADAAKVMKTKGSEKTPEEGTASDKKAEQEKGVEKKAEQEEAKGSDEGKEDGGESKAAEPKARSPEGSEPSKEAAAAASKEQGNDEEAAKKDKKEKNKPKDAAVVERSLPLPIQAAEPPVSAAQWPAHAHGGYTSYVAQPVLSYNMAQPSASVSYYASRPEMAVSVHQQQPMAPPPWDPAYAHSPYAYLPYAPMAPAPELYYDHYAPPGTRSSPPRQDSYHLFDDENPNSCSLM